MELTVIHLFPTHKKVIMNCDTNDGFLHFSPEEMPKACTKLKNKRASRLGHLPREIMKTLIYIWKENYYSNGLTEKENRPSDNPPSFRPIGILQLEF